MITSFVIILSLSNALTGCSVRSPMARVVGGLEAPFHRFEPNNVEFKKFKNIFVQYATKDGERDKQLRHFFDAYDRVRNEYVYAVEDDILINAAIEGVQDINATPGFIPSRQVVEAALDRMLTSLDPHSSYMNPEAFKASQDITNGEFGGLGIEIKMTNGFIEIITPMVDTPAYEAGLKPGDLITHVEGDPIQLMSLADAIKRLRGRPGSAVEITIRRQQLGSFNVTVMRDVITVKPVKWRIENGVGLIQITHFNARSIDAVEDAVNAIRSKSKEGVSGFVLDLRNNPGGLLNQSVGIADAFLEEGVIVSVRDRQGEQRRYNSRSGDMTFGSQMVVLINRGSASASEIVAGALQDNKRAILMGDRSFGKGSVQTIAPLDWDGALRLTTALYYLPSGRTIQGSGVDPDLITVGEKASIGKREADLPNALEINGQSGQLTVGSQLYTEYCIPAGDKRDDKLLGCAIMFLNAGSKDSFLNLMEIRKNS